MNSGFQVIVGNIGCVYDGTSSSEADEAYREYVEQSKGGYGRAAGESVVMTENNEPVREFLGRLIDESGESHNTK